MKELVVTKDTVMLLVDEVHRSKGKDIPDWKCLFGYYNVCLASVITPFSVMVWNLYNQLNGLRAETYESFMRLPAIFVDCVQVIQGELARIQKIRDRAAEQQQVNAQRLRNKHGRR